jgi:sugar (pentulose or hexulose) kinase
MAEAAVLGIDLGTTEAKAALVALDGRLLGLGRAAYPLDLGPGGRAEQSPEHWWTAVAAAVRAIDASGVEILAVCGVAQGPTLAVLDAEGAPVRPAITWQDRRATGGAAGGFGLLPKLAWLAREEPVSVERAAWLLPAWDALGLWLTGRAATALQGHETALDGEALRDAGVPADRVPAAVPVGSVLGPLRAAAAEAVGLRPGIPVVAGVNDGMASVLGAGLRDPGDAVDTGGTSGGIAICADRPLTVPGLYSAPSPLHGRWILGGAMAATGAAVDWLRTAVLGDRWTVDALFAAAAAVQPGADGLLFLPYLAGERAPIFDDAARGAFVGLTLAHGTGHLARAVLEGGAFAVRHVAEPILAAGIPLRSVRIAGRPTPGDLWARIKADVLGVPTLIPSVGDTAVVGAAILAAAGVGAVGSLEAGVAAMTSIARTLEPDPSATARYDAMFAIYRDLYPALRPVFRAATVR